MLKAMQPSVQQVVVRPVANQQPTQHTHQATQHPVSNINFGGIKSQNAQASQNVGMSVNALLRNISNRAVVDTPKEETIENVYGKPVNPQLDIKRVEELWVRYSRSVSESDTHLYSLMKQTPLVENDVVILKASNSLQSAKLLESSDLIAFLRRETGVPTLSLKVDITEERVEESKKAAYTSKEKLEVLVKNNPDIELLINELNLDVDF